MLPSPSLRANYAVRLKASVEGKTERKDEERERERDRGRRRGRKMWWGETGRTSIIKITSQITSGNKSTASGRPQPQKLDEKGVLRRRLTSAALRRSRHNREPRLDQMPLPAVTRSTQPRTHTHRHAGAAGARG